MCILIVDDCDEIRELFELVLADGGYHDVVALSSARAALSLLAGEGPFTVKRTPIDLIFLDAVMPEMDGFQACEHIRQYSRYADLPIVMTTSLDDAESVDKAFKSGATDY